jgi:hypothetical protein
VTEGEVVSGIGQLVAADEYSDDRYIQIGPMLARPSRRADGTVDRAAFRAYLRHRPVTQQVARGAPEYESAWDEGLLRPLPPLPVATQAAVSEAEEIIGLPLPRLLRRLYLEVANGGFGPRSGILGVRGGIRVDDDGDIVELHSGLPSRCSRRPWRGRHQIHR